MGVEEWELGLRCGRVLELFLLISTLGRIRSYNQRCSCTIQIAGKRASE